MTAIEQVKLKPGTTVRHRFAGICTVVEQDNIRTTLRCIDTSGDEWLQRTGRGKTFTETESRNLNHAPDGKV